MLVCITDQAEFPSLAVASVRSTYWISGMINAESESTTSLLTALSESATTESLRELSIKISGIYRNEKYVSVLLNILITRKTKMVPILHHLAHLSGTGQLLPCCLSCFVPMQLLWVSMALRKEFILHLSTKLSSGFQRDAFFRASPAHVTRKMTKLKFKQQMRAPQSYFCTTKRA